MPLDSAPSPPLRLAIHRGAEVLGVLAGVQGRRTPFQSGGWLTCHAKAHGGTDDLVLVEIANENARLLLPLEIARLGPLRLADIPGGKLASFHAPIIAGEMPASFIACLRDAGRRLGIHAFTFRDCPGLVDEAANPLLMLAHGRAPSPVAKLTISGGGEVLLARLSDKDDRKKLRQMERRLAELGALSWGWAEGAARADALDALHAWKATRFAQMGIENPFAADVARAFLNAAASGDEPPLRLFVLRVDARPVALLGGAVADGQFSAIVIAHDPDPVIERTSPGFVLLSYFVRHLADEGFRHFDLGVGEARYKARFCPEPMVMVDCALGTGAMGQVAAWGFLAARALKRLFKESRLAMALLARLRRLRGSSQAMP